FGLDDYIDYIRDFIRHIGAEELHVVSVCQPTVPVLAAVSLMADDGEKTPRSLVMMGGPIDARSSPTAVNNLATQNPMSWFENNVIHTVP
ncbi:polyhydroxyalkanoate depolymerase, partial [Halomonas sp. SIMBA_159]